ncbi:MAG: FxsA family protein [Marmoricola sp.]|nr:FxsA family protein [Marmoricola sp.]
MSRTKRRGFPWWLLVVAFVVVPLVEIYVIIQIGQVIGAWWTILLLIADSILGSWLVKLEGARAWRALTTALEQGRMPTRELADGVLVLVGGILMLTPGFVLDVVGVLCILPLTRPIGRRILSGVISRRLVGVSFGAGAGAGGQPGFPGTTGPWTQQRPGPSVPDNGVVQGEVVDEGPPEGHQPPR